MGSKVWTVSCDREWSVRWRETGRARGEEGGQRWRREGLEGSRETEGPRGRARREPGEREREPKAETQERRGRENTREKGEGRGNRRQSESESD